MSGRRIIQDSDDEDESNLDELQHEHIALPTNGKEDLAISPFPSSQLQSESHRSKRQKVDRHDEQRLSFTFIRSSSEIYESPRKAEANDGWDIPSSAPVSGSNGRSLRSRNALRDSEAEVDTPTTSRYREAEDVKPEESRGGEVESPTKPIQPISINISQETHNEHQGHQHNGNTLESDVDTVDPTKLMRSIEDSEAVDRVSYGDVDDTAIDSESFIDQKGSMERKTDSKNSKSTSKKKIRGKSSSTKSERENGTAEPDEIPVAAREAADESPCEEKRQSGRKRKRTRKSKSRRVASSVSSQEDHNQSQLAEVHDHSSIEDKHNSQNPIDETLVEGQVEQENDQSYVQDDREEFEVPGDQSPANSGQEPVEKKSKRGRKAKKAKPSKLSKRTITPEVDKIDNVEIDKDEAGHQSAATGRESTPVLSQNGALSEVTPNTSLKRASQPDDSDSKGLNMTGLQTPKKEVSMGNGSHSPLNSGKVPYRVGLSKSARIQPLLRIVKK